MFSVKGVMPVTFTGIPNWAMAWTAPKTAAAPDMSVFIVSIPVATMGALAGLWFLHMPLSIYAQIGLVLLVGLAAKNAILIVEFAMAEREKGKGFREAAMDAAQLRFRPILMTAISSIAGFMPLVVAAGAGAASRQAIGTAVVGGMVAATVMSLLFTPVFYVVMQKISGFRKKKPETGLTAEKEAV